MVDFTDRFAARIRRDRLNLAWRACEYRSMAKASFNSAETAFERIRRSMPSFLVRSARGCVFATAPNRISFDD
jgi:hypothetical protein